MSRKGHGWLESHRLAAGFVLKAFKKVANKEKTNMSTIKRLLIIILSPICAFFLLVIIFGVSEELKQKKLPQPTNQAEIVNTTEEPKEPAVAKGDAGLSQTEKKQIFHEILESENRAVNEAQANYPVPYYENLEIGQSYRLSAQTPLMPELNPQDPIAAIAQIKDIPAETSIKILKTVNKQRTPWYQVEVAGFGQGWINSHALIGQFQAEETTQFDRQFELEEELIEQYNQEIIQKHGLSENELYKIIVEGVENNWP